MKKIENIWEKDKSKRRKNGRGKKKRKIRKRLTFKIVLFHFLNSNLFSSQIS